MCVHLLKLGESGACSPREIRDLQSLRLFLVDSETTQKIALFWTKATFLWKFQGVGESTVSESVPIWKALLQ